MRKLIVGLGALVIPAMVAGLATSGCDEADKLNEGICGPCGSVLTGDVSISGDARLDGFFAAVGDLGKVTGKINGNFEANLAELEAIFGIAGEAGASGDLSGRVDALILAIQGEIQANASGGLQIAYAPPKCSASLDIAVEAQANCEAKAGCEADVDPGSVSVTCEGECTGACEGGCDASATAKCEVSGGSVECNGSCEGTCTVELTAAAECNGTCNGECQGNCSASTTDGNGQATCAGSCDGTCRGTCSMTGSAAANCTGKCSGSCTVDAPSGGCEVGATAKCEGKCSGQCSGGCTGEATPPSASVNCEATADCQASAKAQGSANLECTPPSLDIQFVFTGAASADAAARAEAQAVFNAKLDALKVKGAAMLQGLAQYKMLFQGDAELNIQPPVANIQTQLEGFATAAVDGNFNFDIPKGRIICLLGAFEEAVDLAAKISTEASGNITAQAKFATALTGGFSG